MSHNALSEIFQSTLPVWGATDDGRTISADQRKFQSTLPVWGATDIKGDPEANDGISIHTPRVGSDFEVVHLRLMLRIISIHTPRVGSDRKNR